MREENDINDIQIDCATGREEWMKKKDLIKITVTLKLSVSVYRSYTTIKSKAKSCFLVAFAGLG